MRLNPSQLSAYRNVILPNRHAVLICGRGWGKTETAIHVIMREFLRFKDPSWKFWWISKELKQAKAIAWERIWRKYGKYLKHANRQEAYMTNQYGVWLRFVGTESDPDAVRGDNIYWAVWDEPYICHFSFLDEIIEPALRHDKSKLILIGTVPAAHEDIDPQWFPFIERAQREGRVYIGTTRENEGYGLPKGFVDERLKEAKERGLLEVAERELLCKLPEWQVGFHRLIEKTLTRKMRSASEAVFRAVAIDPHTSRPNAVVVAEIFEDGFVQIPLAAYVDQPIDNVIKFCKAVEKRRGLIQYRFIDPKFATQRFNIFGFPNLKRYLYSKAFPVQLASSDFDLFFQRMQNLLVNNKLKIYEKGAYDLYRQLRDYRAVEVRGKYKKRYAQEDDLVDCLRPPSLTTLK